MREKSSLRPVVDEAMRETWDDFVSDTGCFPDDFTLLPRRRLMFIPKVWAGLVADYLAVSLGRLHDDAALAAAEARGRAAGALAGSIDMRDDAANAIVALIHRDFQSEDRGLAAAALAGAALMVRDLPLSHTKETTENEVRP